MVVTINNGSKRQSAYSYDKKRGMLVKVSTKKVDAPKPKRYCASPVIISNDVKALIKIK